MDWFHSGLTKEFESFFNTSESYKRYTVDYNDDNIVLKFEVPGVEKENLKVRRKGSNLVVTVNEKESLFHCKKLCDLDNLSATHRLGVLTITIPYLEETKPKEQEVDIL